MDPSLSYDLHSGFYEKTSSDLDRLKRYTNFFDSNSIDVWRHRRMLSCVDPILDFYKNKNWLAVGDGCYGTTSMYIEGKGSYSLATDIDVSALKVANSKGLIASYQYANAENLPFDDNSFDYSICKEAYHHFPRPNMAFYEMSRVSREGFVLIEPADWLPSPPLRHVLTSVKRKLTKLLGIKVPHADTGCYEPIGNYVYTVSIREITKMSVALNYPVIAYKRFHDLWEPLYNTTTTNSIVFLGLKSKLFLQTLLKVLGLSTYNRLQVIVFKKTPDQELLKRLSSHSFSIDFLPKNPYI